MLDPSVRVITSVCEGFACALASTKMPGEAMGMPVKPLFSSVSRLGRSYMLVDGSRRLRLNALFYCMSKICSAWHERNELTR